MRIGIKGFTAGSGTRNTQPLPLRDIRRSESNYERARSELAESAIDRSLAFAAAATRRSGIDAAREAAPRS